MDRALTHSFRPMLGLACEFMLKLLLEAKDWSYIHGQRQLRSSAPAHNDTAVLQMYDSEKQPQQDAWTSVIEPGIMARAKCFQQHHRLDFSHCCDGMGWEWLLQQPSTSLWQMETKPAPLTLNLWVLLEQPHLQFATVQLVSSSSNVGKGDLVTLEA